MSADVLASGWAKALGGDRKQFNMFIEKMLDGFAYHKIVVDKAGKPVDYVFLEVNRAFEKMTGLKRAQIIGKKVTEVIPGIEKDPANWIGVYGRVALTGEPVQFENHAIPLGKWYHVSAYCPEKGYFVALFEDITESKNIENTIKTELDRFYIALSSMQGAILLVSAEGQVEFANQSFSDYFGLKESPTALKGLASDVIIAKIKNSYVYADKETNRIKEIVDAGKSVTGEEVAMTGNRTCLRDFTPLSRDGKSFSRLWQHLDITERKKAEEALKSSKLMLESVFNNMYEGVFILDKTGKVIDFNEAFWRINKFKNREETLRSINSLGTLFKAYRLDGSYVSFEEWPATKALQGESGNSQEYIVERTDLGVHWITSNSYAPLRDEKGEIVGAIQTMHDITERTKADNALRKQSSLVDLSPDAIIVKKMNDTITFWSQGAQNLYGWTKEEAIVKKSRVLLKTKFPEPYEEILSQLKCQGRWSGEKIQQTKNGREIIVDSRWLATFDIQGKLDEILETNVDVTERKQLQNKLEEYATNLEKLVEERTKQLKDSERLAAIGATAGMVGHDIRNPLQAIVGDLYLAREEIADMPNSERKQAMQDSLTEIEKNIDYINKIVADLQDFARPLKPNVEETDLKRIIDELLAKNGLPDDIKVSIKVETGKIVADATFINRIMYNLVTNAIQAMPNGGKLTIHAYKEANSTVISVKDTGVGIPHAVKGKLFTPMFTTKARGQGFGLAVIKRMTESLGGTVSFESEEGKGTTFEVRLPAQKVKP